MVDEVIIVYSDTSNYGVTVNYVNQIEGLGTLVNWEPDIKTWPHSNEINKRNFALQVARGLGFTHFIMMDCDECYDAKELMRDKESLSNSKHMNGFVHQLKVYIKEPTLQCNDHTLVPGIHKLNQDTEFRFANTHYPFAYDAQGHAHIDPTRRLNYKDGIMMSGATMHHFSHVRRNIRQKIQNSSAKNNLLKSSLLTDYENACPGYACEFYRDILIEVPNRFNIEI